MIQVGAESLGELKWCCLFFQGAEGLKWVKKGKGIHFDSKQTVKFLPGSSKFRAHAVPVWALVVCAQSMGVLPCSQQMLFVLSVPFSTPCRQSLLHQYITEVRDPSEGKGRMTKKKKK